MTSNTPCELTTIEQAIRPIVMPVSDALAPYVGGLMAVEIDRVPPIEQRVAPHESVVLSVQLPRGSQAGAHQGALGRNTRITGIRRRVGSFVPASDCVTLFALLTPLGAVTLLDGQPLSGASRIRARVDEPLDARLARELESQIALTATLPGKLRALGAWLEQRASLPREVSAVAMRTARAAMRVLAEPLCPIDELADDELLSRRQLERDFARWLGISPRHLANVARVQAVSRLACRGESMASAASGAGFADQSHMSRVVREFTGLTPQRFVRAHTTPMSRAFREATRGATVYL